MPPTTPLSPKRERQLVRQVQRGDRNALGELLRLYHRRIYHICLRMVNNASDAADLTQDTLVRAVQNADQFRGDARFGTWLSRIAMNVSITHLRRKRSRSMTSLDMEIGHEGQTRPLRDFIQADREPMPDENVSMDEERRRLLNVLSGLDLAHRSIILLRDIQGLDYQEIAEVLDIPVGTVKSRLFRARLALRMAMTGQDRSKSEVTDE